MMIEMIVWSGQHDPRTAAPAEFLERASTDREGLIAEIRDQLVADHAIAV